MKRILITTTALACLGLAFIASTNGDTLTTRIDNAVHDLEKVHAPIPHAALHARALEILHSMSATADTLDPCIPGSTAHGPCRTQDILRGAVVAKDDGPSFNEIARVDNCVAFVKTTMEKVNCVKQ